MRALSFVERYGPDVPMYRAGLATEELREYIDSFAESIRQGIPAQACDAAPEAWKRRADERAEGFDAEDVKELAGLLRKHLGRARYPARQRTATDAMREAAAETQRYGEQAQDIHPSQAEVRLRGRDSEQPEPMSDLEFFKVAAAESAGFCDE